ncbi:MAG: DUF262 domain-containing HNH endonuclease family protein [Nostoc desertorum CM1-VF14]|jgi:hypothetical protein|nr:DUF262 domain-containing HNH endonuclease family protein [Nostoc desertorum CM1-VF14]
MDISRIFQTSSVLISDFFTQGGTGYYIPLYQREYSWDDENIEQLMDDICSGVLNILSSQEDTIHFMGTIILVTEVNVKANVNPQDHRAIPPRIDNIIDGQQRISTIALLACCLYQKIFEIKNKLPQSSERYEIDGLREAADTYLTSIQELFSFDLMRGIPKRKPIVIRGSLDGWTLDEDETKHYKSDVSSYLANFIRTIHDIENKNVGNFPKPQKNSLVSKNIQLIQDWLGQVEKSHKNDHTNYPPAWDIVEKIDQRELWIYERPNLYKIVKNCQNLDINSLDRTQNYICSLVQIFAFSSYLLQRCCFTVIRPVSQVRAFDMFQSLNATGTPLTAIETFKPLVVNIADSNGQGFKGSNFDKSFTKIEDLMKKLQSASSKNQRTNEYLTLFSLTYEGKSLPKQFSTQRKWLIDKFEQGSPSKEGQEPLLTEKEIFIQQMADIAEYSKKIIYSQDNINKSLPELNLLDESQRKISSFCLLYLKDANHKMAHTTLSRFYALAIRYQVTEEDEDEQNNITPHKEFAIACQVIAAFFTLWRSALPNTGLDNVYRELLQKKLSWEKGDDSVNIEVLKKHLKNALEEKGIGNKDSWKTKAINYLGYDKVKTVCNFVLFISSNDTICDSQEPGLMKIGVLGSSKSYLEPSQWNSDSLKSIEHIAPQKPDLRFDSNWDKAIYENDEYDQIGNLTLLPKPINSSASNKGWIEKWIYYQHLAETDPEKLKNLKQTAEQNGVELKDSTIDLLKKSSYAYHIKPIVELGVMGNWNKNLVEKRTERICDILWERMYEWLS